MTLRIDLIGAGYAGTRLVRAFEHVAAGRGEDIDARTYSRADTAALPDDPARIHLMYEGADVVINAANDDQHLSILNILQHVNGFVLSEKPLVAPQDSVPDRWAGVWESGDRFAMNCIERYSPAVDHVLAQTRQRDLRIARIDFTWAKNRFDDPRPTVGVVSEVVHPLDLCCYLTGASAEDVHLHNAAVINSDYTSLTDDTPESVQIMASMNDVAVTGYSSFAHPDRRRAFDIILVGDDGAREYVELIFDDPGWDHDRLRHWSADGAQPCQDTAFITGGTAPETCGKLCLFAEDVLWGDHGRRYTTFVEAAGLQRLLADIHRFSQDALSLRYGRGPRRTTLDRNNLERLG